MSDALTDRYRVLAVNLFGYGETTPWPGNTSQSLYAQASLVLALPGMDAGTTTLSAIHSVRQSP
jgi:pimeloyl-ACP methyl ester carboxylesterase